MIAIFKREFKSCFDNVVGWLFISAILALYGLYFYAYNLRNGYAYVSYTLSSVAFLILIAVPVLTMRIMAEDKKNKTDQLILTAPVSVIKIVVGKFLAMAAVFSIAILVICVTPLVLSFYGTVPMGESYTAILGFWLFGLTCIAIGEFVSSLTESQIIAAVISFVVLFAGYMMNGICALISTTGNLFTKILGCYDIYTPMGPFMAGTLDLTGACYFLTVIALVLFLTSQVIEKRRWTMSVKKIGIGAFSIATIVLAFAVCVAVNVGVRNIPTEYTSIDVTYSKLFALTDKTKEYVKSMDEDVTIIAWVAENNADTTIKETLNRFDDLSKHIKVKYVSIIENPDYYRTYTDEQPAENSLFVVGDKRSKVIEYDELYVFSYDYSTYQRSIDAYDAEGQIVSALEYVTMDENLMPKVYMLEAHGEAALSNTYVQTMSKANITSEKLNLLTVDAIPEDCQLLIINAPSEDLSKDDLGKVSEYLANGGDVLYTTTYDLGEQPNMSSILEDFGITKIMGIVMENNSARMYGGIPYYLFPEVVETSYTMDVNNGYVFAPLACGFSVDEDNEKYNYTQILVSSDRSVAKMDTKNATTSEFEDGDIRGPFEIGISASLADKPGSLIVFGSAEIFSDEANSVVAGSNVQLFADIIKRHVNDGDLDLPVIESKGYTVENLVITSFMGVFVGLMIMIFIPLGMTAAGIIIWASRRKR